jgi:Bacterial regulatory helix-turn-helix protein, lysR family
MVRDELSVLSAFLAVAEERSFTKAARRLGVSPSALSHAIRVLKSRSASVCWPGPRAAWRQPKLERNSSPASARRLPMFGAPLLRLRDGAIGLRVACGWLPHGWLPGWCSRRSWVGSRATIRM